MTTSKPISCDWFWGSHGCDMPGGHDGTIHTCGSRDPDGPCSQYDTTAPPDKRVRYTYEDQPDGTPRWADWGPYGEGFGMGPDWGPPNITPPHTHHDDSAVCHACDPPQPHPTQPQNPT
jgi:hypothetical protein